MSKFNKLYNLSKCSLLYSDYTPIKLLRDKMVLHKNLDPPLLWKINQSYIDSTISHVPYLGRISSASVAAKTGEQLRPCPPKHWLGHKTHPRLQRISSLCPRVPACAVMAIRSTAQGGTGIQETFRLFVMTLASVTGDKEVCRS